MHIAVNTPERHKVVVTAQKDTDLKEKMQFADTCRSEQLFL